MPSFPKALAALAGLTAVVHAAVVSQREGHLDISDRYIVTLKPGVDMDRHIGHVQETHAASGSGTHAGVSHLYNMTGFQAYAGHFDNNVIERLQSHEDVEYIEADRILGAAGLISQAGASYGLNLISHKKASKDGYVYDSSGGAGTTIYIVDSGINLRHQEFEGRAVNGYNALPNSKFDDDYGHGTHVAALAGGKTYGVAKHTRLVAVKIMAKGKTSYRVALDGYQWAVNEITKAHLQSKAVVNLSANGSGDRALNAAIQAAANHGVTTVLSAGIKGEPTAWQSSSIIVAATDQKRKAWSMTDLSPRNTLFAPGVNIKSAWIGSPTASQTMSGSSQAAGYVSGLLVYLKGMRSLGDAAQTKRALMSLALPGVVAGAGQSANSFAYNGSGK